MTTKDVEKLDRAIGFSDKLKAALALCDSFPLIKIKTAEDYLAAEGKRKLARELKEQMLTEYAEHPIVIKAKEIQALKVSTEKRLDQFNKDVKAGPMWKYEQTQEEIRLEKERVLAEKARKEQEAETARLVAEQKAEFDKAEKARKAAEKKGDEEAAARAAEAAEAAKIAAQNIKADAAMAPAPVVVVEKTAPQVQCTTVHRWRLTTKDGRKLTKDDFKKTLYIRPEDVPGMPQSCFMLDDSALSGIVKSLGKNHNIPGLEVWTELV